jgi:hypothetical protein
MPRASAAALGARLRAGLTSPRRLRHLFAPRSGPVSSAPLETVRRVLEQAPGPGRRPGAEPPERVIERWFDCHEIARRCLVSHWSPRSYGERQELELLLRGLVARAYFGRLAGARQPVFTGERVQGDAAAVRCWLSRADGRRLPVEHQLHRTAGRWLVVDFTIEGTAFVKGHGAYLRGIVETGSFEDLLWRLRLKEAWSPAPHI